MSERLCEGNICHKLGCYGHCCRDVTFYIPIKEIKKFFPNADVVTIDDLYDIIEEGRPGIYTAGSYYEGTVCFAYARINGPCPYAVDGSCSRHEDRPSACANFLIGSGDCEEVRAEHGLPPVPKDVVRSLRIVVVE